MSPRGGPGCGDSSVPSPQEGKEAIAMILRDLQHTRGWDPVEGEVPGVSPRLMWVSGGLTHPSSSGWTLIPVSVPRPMGTQALPVLPDRG